MDRHEIKALLSSVVEGKLTIDEAVEKFRHLPFHDLNIAKHDHHRPLRNGFQEVIFCEGKNDDDVIQIISSILSKKRNVFATRMSAALGEKVLREFPQADYDERSRTLHIVLKTPEPIPGRLALLCAGTADLPVAEEARRTGEFLGIEAERYYDVGIAGLPRLLHSIEEVRKCDVAIVVAGMEGALPSVVGGLVPIPIIAVPTSVGYGVSLHGIAALLGMLSSCAEGIAVMNIDNGFGAASAAFRILSSNHQHVRSSNYTSL